MVSLVQLDQKVQFLLEHFRKLMCRTPTGLPEHLVAPSAVVCSIDKGAHGGNVGNSSMLGGRLQPSEAHVLIPNQL